MAVLDMDWLWVHELAWYGLINRRDSRIAMAGSLYMNDVGNALNEGIYHRENYEVPDLPCEMRTVRLRCVTIRNPFNRRPDTVSGRLIGAR